MLIKLRSSPKDKTETKHLGKDFKINTLLYTSNGIIHSINYQLSLIIYYLQNLGLIALSISNVSLMNVCVFLKL